MVRPIAIVTLSLVIASLTLGLSLSQQLPETPDDALSHVQELNIETSDEYVWFCPTEYGIKECTLRMEIPEDAGNFSSRGTGWSSPAPTAPAGRPAATL